MNFLAHLHLSGDNDKIMVGNFIGDFVKGRDLGDRYESGIVLGIELHRSIDEFTDRHELVLQSKKRLRPKYRHYSPVIVDVFYDHFLARNWPRFHHESLPDFAARAYELLQKNHDIVPERVNQILPYMMRGNWLLNYAKIDGIHRALSGMAGRTPYESHMEEASADLLEYYNDFSIEFFQFFPELKKFSEEYISSRLEGMNSPLPA